MSSEVSLMEMSALFDSNVTFLESSLSDWSKSLFSSVIDENSKLEMIGDVVMPGSEYIQPAIIDPLVFRECSNDIVLNSHRHSLDASLMMDENYNLMIDPSGEGDSLLEQDGNNFMQLTQLNL